jgi:hypothetical protein
LIQAIEAYYTQNPQAPFVCPVSECGFRFETPRAWALHAIEARHSIELKPPSGTLEMLFSEHDARLARSGQELVDSITRLRLEWGDKGSEQRRKIEEDFSISYNMTRRMCARSRLERVLSGAAISGR